MLIYAGADVNATDKRGYTPLHIVARSQFHQHFTCNFFIHKSKKQRFRTSSLGLNVFGAREMEEKLLPCTKNIQTLTASTETLLF
jgi:hypothetical protein